MTFIDLNNAEDLAQHERLFFSYLRATIATVFNSDTHVADSYQAALTDASPLERAFALHDEPLDVAASLTGARITDDIIRKYDRFIANFQTSANESAITPYSKPIHRYEAVAETYSFAPARVRPSARASEGIGQHFNFAMPSARRLTDPATRTVPMWAFKSLMSRLGYRKPWIDDSMVIFKVDQRYNDRGYPGSLSFETSVGMPTDDYRFSFEEVSYFIDQMIRFAKGSNAPSASVQRLESERQRMLQYR